MKKVDKWVIAFCNIAIMIANAITPASNDTVDIEDFHDFLKSPEKYRNVMSPSSFLLTGGPDN